MDYLVEKWQSELDTTEATSYWNGYEEGYKDGKSDYEAESKKKYCPYADKDCIIGNLVCDEWYQKGRMDFFKQIQEFPIRRDHYDREHGDVEFINGIESVMEYITDILESEE